MGSLTFSTTFAGCQEGYIPVVGHDGQFVCQAPPQAPCDIPAYPLFWVIGFMLIWLLLHEIRLSRFKPQEPGYLDEDGIWRATR